MTIEIVQIEGVKTVSKPWGEEKWIADGHPKFPYAFKRITLKAGHRSSLQFHEKKQETNYILAGSGVLHYSDVPIDVTRYIAGEYTDGEIASIIDSVEQIPLQPGMIFHVFPGFVHRVEAMTDLVQVETSTIELDDVYRLADDTLRQDGRIDSEHN